VESYKFSSAFLFLYALLSFFSIRLSFLSGLPAISINTFKHDRICNNQTQMFSFRDFYADANSGLKNKQQMSGNSISSTNLVLSQSEAAKSLGQKSKKKPSCCCLCSILFRFFSFTPLSLFFSLFLFL
jgi:hypothetical protein